MDRERREVTLSMIFKWYKGDFGPPEVLLPWLVQVRGALGYTMKSITCSMLFIMCTCSAAVLIAARQQETNRTNNFPGSFETR